MAKKSNDLDTDVNCKIGLREILHKLLPELDEEITDESDLFDMGLDSLKAVEFVLEIEDRYCVYFDFDDITYDQFKTIKSVSELIQKKS